MSWKKAVKADKEIESLMGVAGIVAVTGILGEVFEKMFGEDNEKGLKLVVQAVMEHYESKIEDLKNVVENEKRQRSNISKNCEKATMDYLTIKDKYEALKKKTKPTRKKVKKK